MSETAQGQAVLSSIKRRLPYLNPALRRIANYTLRNPTIVKSLTIGELAEKCEVSESTITRFVKELDIRSFPQLKILIAEDLSRAPQAPEQTEEARSVYEDITVEDNVDTITRKIRYRLQHTLDETFSQLSIPEIIRAVEAIEKSETLAFFAVGSSTLAVGSGLMRFVRVGKKCQFFEEQNLQQMSAVALDERSTAIGISNSGRSQAVVRALQVAQQVGARTICITAFPGAPIVNYSDVKLITPTTTVPIGRPEYHESMTSKFAQIAIMDLVYSIYAVRNYERSIEKLEATNRVSEDTRFL
ncbi:MurR/RpiR family transcriptional regulator [Chelativorans sp.]|uniref:MurR/RpiR family transcriptional regulator n=1 Tax=Chelativorans sp. TaxID=2203393 RepID=UPI002810EB5D|nr:MurR/RpiR family transcriptional regulator [Chelativorans sp.]